MRKTKEELEKIKQDLNINKLWSWSKLNTYMTDPYEYLLKYVLRAPEDRKDSIYAVSGGCSHELVEKFYQNELDHQGMLAEYEDKVFEFNTLGLMYERSDRSKNEKIAKKYEDCMKHFFLNHIRVTNKPIIEQFIIIKVEENYFQGYIDFINIEIRDDKKKIIITDWKTSSIYKGDKLLKESGQLLLYGEGIHQKTKMSYDDIIIRFNFMKYVNVTYTQKKGDIKVRQIERNAIGEKLQSNAKTWLKHFKYTEDDIEIFLAQMIDTNGIKYLPKEVQEKFEIKDCFIEVEFNENIIKDHIQYITQKIAEIEEKENQYMLTKNKNIFWKDITRENSYYHANLSGYSANIHEPYKKYLEEYENKEGRKVLEDKSIVEDLAWLDNIL